MTNEQAIAVLKSLIGYYNDEDQDDCYVGFDDEDNEAIDMAIKLLEKQLCEDYIGREELINELKLGYFDKDLQEGKNDPCVIDAMVDWAIRTAKRLPPVTPKFTDEEIQKMQELEQAQLEKAYELGKTESFEEWLNTFNTDSATACYTAVQELKKRLEDE